MPLATPQKQKPARPAKSARAQKKTTRKAAKPKKLSADKLKDTRESAWKQWGDATVTKAFEFAEDYKTFLSSNKTERHCVNTVRQLAQEAGFISLEEAEKQLSQGDLNTRGLTVYAENRGKNIILARLGKRPLSDGARMILSHVDSPRLDLKVRPLYEDSGIGFLKTHYYGGIKKYQWPTIPLALYGRVVLTDGSTIDISLGDKEDEPVLYISDLLPHLGRKQMEKTLSEGIGAEELNLLAGSIPDKKTKSEKSPVKLAILTHLYKEYGFTEGDFVSADIEIVPAGPARDVGFDRSMIMGYGHDDRVCAYTSLQAMLDAKTPLHAQMAMFVDKEEIGSTSNTGATSVFFYDTLGRLLALEEGLPARTELDTQIRGVLAASQAISADVTAAYDPDYKEVFDANNSAKLGWGVAVEKYTGARGKSYTSEANAEYMAEIRKVLDDARVPWQTGGLGKVDVGGGGTIAMFLAEYNMDIVDAGLPVLSMHAPYEVVSKADVYALYLGYSAFFKS